MKTAQKPQARRQDLPSFRVLPLPQGHLTWVAISLLLLVQISVSLLRIHAPFVDGRIHVCFDNAYFLRMALHSHDGSIPDLRKWSGLASYQYDSQDRPQSISIYSRHPILFPALFGLYARVVGYEEYVPRSFALFFSLSSTVLLFLVLSRLLSSRLLVFVLSLVYILLPLKFAYFDALKYEIYSEFTFLLLAFSFLSLPISPRYRALFYGALFLVFQSDFPNYVPAFLLLVYLYFQRNSLHDVRIFKISCLVSLVSVLLSGSLQFLLGFTPQAIHGAVSYRMSGELEHTGFWDWLARQLLFLKTNFGEIHLAVLGCLILYVLYARMVRRKAMNPLIVLSGILLLPALGWMLVFRNHVLVHHYVQWPIGTAYLLLLGGILADFQELPLYQPRTLLVTLLLLSPLFTSLAINTSIENRNLQSGFGNEEDIGTIRSLGKRILYFKDGISGIPGWWDGPVIQLYTDPIYTQKCHAPPTRSAAIDSVPILNPATDLIVVWRNREAVASFERYFKSRYPKNQIATYRTSPTFVFYEIK